MKQKDTAAWMVSEFPVELRRKFVASCTIKGVTVAKQLEKIVSAHLKKEAACSQL